MNISGLLSLFESLKAYRTLRDDLETGSPPAPLGILRAARPALLAALECDLDRPLLVLAGPAERAKALTHSLRQWSPDPERVLQFPGPLTLFYERAPWTEEVIADRLRILSALQTPSKEPILLVASARAAIQPTMPVREFKSSVRELRLGQSIDLQRTLRQWAGLGYEPVSVVERPGQFSHRGGILDIFPPADQLPVRIELFGFQIDSLRRFDPSTQRSEEHVEEITITPAREALPRHGPRVADRVADQLSGDLPADIEAELEDHLKGLESAAPFPGLEFYLPLFYSQPSTLLDYLPSGTLIVIDDERELTDQWADLEEEALNLKGSAKEAGALPPDYPLPYVTWSEWTEKLSDRPTLTLGYGEAPTDSLLSDHFVPAPHFGGQLKPLLGHLETARAKRNHVVIASQQAPRLAELWGEEHDYMPPQDEIAQPTETPLTFVHGSLTEGWLLRGFDLGSSHAGLHLLTDTEIFGWRPPAPRRPTHRRKVAPESYFADLSPGDYVVHVDYGIGIFQGLVIRSLEGVEREYLLIDYEGKDQLYVPIHQAYRLSRYIGADDRPPRLSRLGTAQWQRITQRAKEAAQEMARDMLELHAARELAIGHAFSPDSAWQAELEASFPYFETEDQLEAIEDVKADMEKPKPMDRLICGDVGYGKTEVALRAAFKAVMDNKQVAMLVPTTVLAQQHHATFRQRLAAFPVVVDMLSRFRTQSEQQDILHRLATGQIDIIIGTHRLLQKDVEFKDLGLLIVDEEQRFGVTHKERLKKLRTEIDVLTLTATPIPRTLYLALTGVRDISRIETPPEERLPVNTYVGTHDPDLVRRAVIRELDRSGQVFYVHNRVQTIQTVRHRLDQQIPEARFGVAHGQMREHELEEVMQRFVNGEIDVLVCTSIIESGLDIPNANTLIVERADRFGLAQLYQLRGRVGRGAQRAYAYFFHPRLTRLTTEARQRLETIQEADELGSGYTIAMRDLEIRGAGDILGTRQSGHISAIGFNLYVRLLSRAVKELKAKYEGEPPPPEPLTSIRMELPLPTRLPEDYIPDSQLRMQIYRRLAELNSLDQIQAMERELVDRFGSLPEPARNLLYQLRLKARAREANVSSITVENNRLALKPAGKEIAHHETLKKHLLGRASVSPRGIWMNLDSSWQQRLVSILHEMADLYAEEPR